MTPININKVYANIKKSANIISFKELTLLKNLLQKLNESSFFVGF